MTNAALPGRKQFIPGLLEKQEEFDFQHARRHYTRLERFLLTWVQIPVFRGQELIFSELPPFSPSQQTVFIRDAADWSSAYMLMEYSCFLG